MQIIFTVAKMIAIVMLVVTGLLRLAQGKITTESPIDVKTSLWYQNKLTPTHLHAPFPRHNLTNWRQFSMCLSGY